MIKIVCVSLFGLMLGFGELASAQKAQSTVTSATPKIQLNKSSEVVKSNVKVGIIAMQAALMQTDEGKHAREFLQKEIQKKEEPLVNQQKKLQKMDADLKSQLSVLSTDQQRQKAEELQKEYNSFLENQKNVQEEARAKEAQEIQKIMQKMSDIIKEIAVARSLDFVVDSTSSGFAYIAKYEDITADVVNLYNKKYSSKK